MSGASETSAAAALRSSARLVESLRDARCFPDATGPIRIIETHASVILLTGSLAYKLKKPLRLAFLDFLSLENRRRFCEEELRLNRRTAPELYRRVVAITGSVEDPRIDGAGPAIEYAVEMRQFDPDALFARTLEMGRITREQVDALADRVADFHATLADSPAPASAASSAPVAPPASERSTAAARRNIAELRALAPPAALAARLGPLAEWLDRACDRFGPLLAERARAGFVRDCHGDLHLSNVALVEGRPVLFDCLEFDADLRAIDVIDEVAFAFMDFVALGRSDLAHRFVNRYLETTGDYAGAVLLLFFAVHRALVRLKVALIRSRQAGLDAAGQARSEHEITRPLAAAERLCGPPAPRLFITCGLAGSGKTTVSSELVESLGAIRLRSDVERKRRAGLAAAARSGSPIGGGLYDPEGSARTYEHLARLAQVLLESGQSVIVDAAFLERAQRARFRAIARAGGFEFRMLVCVAPVEVLRARIAARAVAGRDASEADLAVLEHQVAHDEAPTEDERAEIVVIETDRPLERVRESVRALALAG